MEEDQGWHHCEQCAPHPGTYQHQIRNRNQHQTFSISYPLSSAPRGLFLPCTHHSSISCINHHSFHLHQFAFSILHTVFSHNLSRRNPTAFPESVSVSHLQLHPTLCIFHPFQHLYLHLIFIASAFSATAQHLHQHSATASSNSLIASVSICISEQPIDHL